MLIYRQTGSTFLTAVVSALESVPYLTFGLLAGALSDRWDRRTMMVGADLVDTLLLGSVPVAYWLGILTVPHILVVAFAGPAVAVFFDGANFGALPVLVGRHSDRPGERRDLGVRVPGRDDGAGPRRGVPGGGGARDADRRRRAQLRRLGDVRPGDLALAPEPGPASAEVHRAARSARDIREGLVFLVRHPGVRTMTMIGTLQCIAGGAFVALDVVWCDQVLGIGTGGWRFGLVFSAWAVGGILAVDGAATAASPYQCRPASLSRLCRSRR